MRQNNLLKQITDQQTVLMLELYLYNFSITYIFFLPLKIDIIISTLNISGTRACLNIKLNKVYFSSTILSPQK